MHTCLCAMGSAQSWVSITLLYCFLMMPLGNFLMSFMAHPLYRHTQRRSRSVQTQGVHVKRSCSFLFAIPIWKKHDRYAILASACGNALINIKYIHLQAVLERSVREKERMVTLWGKGPLSCSSPVKMQVIFGSQHFSGPQV